MAAGYNHVCCIGQIAGGPWHNEGVDGRPASAALRLAIPEPSRSGEVYTTFVRVECYGRTVPDALALHAGDVALIEGKLSWSKGSDEGKAGLCVTAWRVLKLASGLPAAG